MSDVLLQYALRNVWCSPNQDTQVTFRLARNSDDGGSLNTTRVMNRTIRLPETKKYYHTFVVGGIKPYLLKLNKVRDRWYNLQDIANTNNTLIHIYNNVGLQLPLKYAWYNVTLDNMLVIAFETIRIPGFNVFAKSTSPYDNNSIYLHFYSNAYFGSQADVNSGYLDYLNIQSFEIKTLQDRLAVQDAYNALIAPTHGKALCFKNGTIVDNLLTGNTAIGDFCSIIYDSSISEVINFQLSNLSGFVSELDSCGKYLIHYLPSTDRFFITNFFDDLEFYIYRTDVLNKPGLLFPALKQSSVRMVTHRDFSLSAPDVNAYVDYFNYLGYTGTTLNNLGVKLIVRSSGTNFEVPYEASRFKELYLSMKNLQERQSQPLNLVWLSLRNQNNFVPWSASELEKSSMLLFMRQQIPGNPSSGLDYQQGINKELVTSAYGYNAISQIVGNSYLTPVDIGGGMKGVELPPAYWINSTIFEYDSSGKLLGWFNSTSGYTYTCVYPTTAIVEVLGGNGNRTLSDVTGTNNLPIPDNDSYRVYFTLLENNVPTGWSDITGDDTKYIVNGSVGNKTLYWVSNITTNYRLMVRTLRKFLCYDIDLPSSQGELSFDLSQNISYGNDSYTQIMQVPCGDLDLFLNGHSMIEGVDYYLDFPSVFLCNKKHLTSDPLNTTQHITVRFSGFCNSDLTHKQPDELGFVKYGMLSRNNEYRIRDDRNIRIVVDGRLYLKSDVTFSENVSIANQNGGFQNGLPYSVRDVEVPVTQYTNSDTATLHEQAISETNAYSAYLTQYLPDATEDSAMSIPVKYIVYSPFVNKIVYLVMNGLFNDSVIRGVYSDSDLREMCAPYQQLLDNDPISINNTIDLNFIEVQPHYFPGRVSLQAYQMSCIVRIINLFALGKITPNNFFTVS